MKPEKKYLSSIPRAYREMKEEQADYLFFYTVLLWKKRYGIETCAMFIRTLCEMFQCDKSIIMNLLVDIQMYPEKYKHDVRHVAFLMYAMNVPVDLISWTLHIKAVYIRGWVKAQLQDCPEIKRLFTDTQTGEIMKLLLAWNNLKGLPI